MSRSDVDIHAAVRAQFPADPPRRLGVAVSGGGDSVALLHILHRCFASENVTLFAASVDHGLRPGSAAEADQVGLMCRTLDVPHSVLHWRDRAEDGNLQDQARRARYELLCAWAKSRQIAVLALGHTADDQAETVLLRLGRASGVTGLAAMPVQRMSDGITLVRPMLDLMRDDLRAYLRRNAIAWVDDPSNDDLRFDRIKARRALAELAPLGITTQALAEVARNMGQARDALDWSCHLAARDLVCVNGGDLVLDQDKFAALPEEIARHLLIGAIAWISSAEYPPRRVPMQAFVAAVREGRSATLNGCRVLPQGPSIWISREYNAVRDIRCPPGDVWDTRWRLTGPPEQVKCELRALGRQGLMHCDSWRATGRPQAALLSSPSVWRGDTLVSAPLAGRPDGWQAERLGGGDGFFASLLSH